MGGKTKQSQRTKNNVRPSSSGRSAEILGNIKVEPNLVNIGGGKVLPALFPTLTVASMDQGLNPELQMCLKKLNKKDPITKAKALQELTDLASTSNVDDLVAALPNWAHFYKILTADPDRKVREFTQMCHGAVMGAVGRRAAPALRALVPAWLQAQHDDHAPAHAHAHRSLTTTFPDNKLPEVISFCKAEVMAHLLDNLIGNGESALNSRNKLESPEEKELVHVRVVTSSLRGLEFTVRRLPAALHAWLWAELAPLLRHAAFWKMPAHQALTLRAAWYSTVGVVAERFKGEFGEQYGAKTLRLLVCGPREPPAPLWDCTLLVMHHVPNWPKYLDKKELLAKRILDVLQTGGWGDAKHLSNMLLPLLAHLPEDILTKQFYETFFDALFIGLDKKSILSSKSERQSWIAGLAECLRYLSVQNSDYGVEVATYVHRTWLEKALYPLNDSQVKTNLIKCSATNMASLVKYWLKQSKEENSEKFDQLSRNFWQNVGSTVLADIDKLSTDHEDIGRSIDGHTILLKTLKTAFGQDPKKKQSIKFDGDAGPDADEVPAPALQCDTSITERYQHNLDETVEKICAHYFEFAEKKQLSSAVLTPLYTLIVDYDSENLFMALARQFDTDSVYKFYDKILRTWLAGDTMRCKPVADIVFLVLKYLSEEEQKLVFKSFNQFPPPVVEWCISLALSHPYCGRAAVRCWLRSPLVELSVEAVSRRAALDGDTRARNLLLMCLAQDSEGELAITPQAVTGIVQTLSAALVRAVGGEGEVEGAAALGGAVATALAAASALPDQYDELLLHLFALTLRLHRGEGVAVETWCEARASWQDGLAALPAPRRRAVRARAAGLLRAHLARRPLRLDAGEIEHVVSTVPYLLNRTGDPSPAAVAEISSFTRELFDAAPVDRSVVVRPALRYDCVVAKLNCPFDDDDELARAVVIDSADPALVELSKEDFIAYAGECLFRAIYLKTTLLPEAGEDEEQTGWCDALLKDGYLATVLTRVVYDLAIVSTLHEGYAFWPHYELIQKTKQKLDTVLDDIIREMSPELRITIGTKILQLSLLKGYYWAFAITRYDKKVQLEMARNSENEKTLVKSESLDKGDCASEKEENIVKPESLDKDNCSSRNEEMLVKSESLEKDDCSNKSEENLVKAESSEKDDCSSKKGENLVRAESLEKVNSASENVKVNSASEKLPKVDSLEKVCCSSKKEENNVITESSTHASESHHKAHHSCRHEKKLVKADSTENIIYLEDKMTGSGFFHSTQARELATPTAEVLRCKHQVMVRSVVASRPRLDHAARSQPYCVNYIIDLYYKHNDIMLYEIELAEVAWRDVVANAAVAEYLAELVRREGWGMLAHQWDFVTISLCSLLNSVQKSRRYWNCPKVSMLACSVLRLYKTVYEFVSTVRERSQKEQPSAHVAHLPTEWDDMFAPDLAANLLVLVLELIENASPALTSHETRVIGEVMSVTPIVRWSTGATAMRKAESAGAAAGSSPLTHLARRCAALLAAPAHAHRKLLARTLLRALAETLVLHDAEQLARWTAECDDNSCESESEQQAPPPPLWPQLSLEFFRDAYLLLEDVVDTALAHVEVGEATCEMVPFTDSYSMALGWALLLDALAELVDLARGDLVHHYTQIFRERFHGEKAAVAALRLVPARVFQFARDHCAAAPPVHHLFAELQPHTVDDPVSSSMLSSAWCRALYVCVCGAGGGAVRGWRGAAAPARAALLDRLVREYVAPRAVLLQLQDVHARRAQLPDAEIQVHFSTNEVSCIYEIEDRPLELRIWLSRLHPLAPPRVAPPAPPAPQDTQWLCVYLAQQRGTVWGALQLWRGAVDARVAAAAQCYICYCRMHPATGRLPRVLCHTCRNKFHNACLRKWFTTSNKSNCPLCRAAF